MKLQFRQIEPFVKNPPDDIAAILVYGPDEGLVRERLKKLTQNIVEDVNDPFNVAELDGGALADNPALLLDEAQSQSLMGGRRVVRVRGQSEKATVAIKNALQSLKPGDNLVLIEGDDLGPRSGLRLLFEKEKNAAALPCYVEDAGDLSRLIAGQIREAGYHIAQDALAHIAEYVVGDRGMARRETDKLMLYMGTNKNIELDDVIAVIGDSGARKLDDFARHVAGGRHAPADRILNALLAEGTNIVVMLRTLQNHFTRLHIAKAKTADGMDIKAAMKSLKPPVFWKHENDFSAQVRALPTSRIEKALNILCSAEAQCKQTGALPELITGRAVMALCQMTKSR